MTPGDRVVYAEDPSFIPEYEPVGVVVVPTDEEVDYAREQNRGADRGDVLVEWEGEEWNRAWHRPADLKVIP